jgi:ubiquinone/menaquinone biosynthesis C-methylase UbiE
MPNWQLIFQQHAAEYEQLVAREDHQGNILRTLAQICAFDGADVVELGAGTGRFTCMLAPTARTITATDASRHMLETAVVKLGRLGLRNWRVSVADNRRLPLEDGTADVAIAGWTLGVFPSWNKETWRSDVERALAEMKRVLRPGSTAIVFEALGWQETPQPPPHFVPYFALLEEEHGFESTWIRTDYKFESPAEAETLTRFFFGDALADRITEERSLILPECTGIWWLTTG